MSFSIYKYNEMFVYTFQQQLYDTLVISISQFDWFLVIIFFTLGICTSLTPCFISIVPLSIAYIKSRAHLNPNKNSFIIGLLMSIFLVIIVLNSLNYKYMNYIHKIPLLSSIVLFFVSLNLLQLINFSFSLKSFNPILGELNQFKHNFIYDYIAGSLVGISTLPCNSSIIYIISFWLSHSNSISYYILYYIVYSIGYIVSILLILNFSINSSHMYFIKYIWDIMVPISGSIILCLSLFNVLEKLFY